MLHLPTRLLAFSLACLKCMQSSRGNYYETYHGPTQLGSPETPCRQKTHPSQLASYRITATKRPRHLPPFPRIFSPQFHMQHASWRGKFVQPRIQSSTPDASSSQTKQTTRLRSRDRRIRSYRMFKLSYRFQGVRVRFGCSKPRWSAGSSFSERMSSSSIQTGRLYV